ncbi:MAG: hypothetical protein LBU64_09620, partial [Planctomycetota bacterium]|nr:hypothetical protein [Planctomycetota bacterium]
GVPAERKVFNRANRAGKDTAAVLHLLRDFLAVAVNPGNAGWLLCRRGEPLSTLTADRLRSARIIMTPAF